MCDHETAPIEGMHDFDSLRWRVIRPTMDEEKCTKCGACRYHCPMGVIHADGKTMRINYNKCIGCGICAVNCLIHAITMKPNSGANG